MAIVCEVQVSFDRGQVRPQRRHNCRHTKALVVPATSFCTT